MQVKASLVTTVLNEADNITAFLKSIEKQSVLPDEIIIVDAESTDQTVELIKKSNLKITIIIKKCNRSQGRNIAIKKAKNDLILLTDAGNILDKNWVRELINTFYLNKKIDVVGGWYKPLIENQWQKALAKVLNFNVQNIKSKIFIPSCRSMGLKKSIWQKVGGFPENIETTSEDTIFGLNLQKAKAKIIFQPQAVVYWQIDNNYKDLYKRIKQYAYTDGFNNLFLSQYKILGIFILINALLIIFKFWQLAIFFSLLYLYLPFWQAKKIDHLKELYRIPLIKLIFIMANIIGYTKGLLKI